MADFWNGLTLFQQITLCIAVPSSLIMVLQLVLLLFGLGSSGDGDMSADVDLNGDGIPDDVSNVDTGMSFIQIGGLKLFSLRGILAFLAIGSWTALLLSTSKGALFSGIIGAAVGLLADVLYALLMHGVGKLQQDGTMKLSNAVGLSAEVYIPIPPKLSGKGKVNLVLQGRLTELEAMSNSEEFVKTGTRVVVIAENGGVLIVTPESGK